MVATKRDVTGKSDILIKTKKRTFTLHKMGMCVCVSVSVKERGGGTIVKYHVKMI